MNFAVDWTPAARSQLAALWLRFTAQRRAITEAQARIDLLLAREPLQRSTPISEGLYAIDEFPLRAKFEVFEAEHAAIVVSVSLLV